MKLRLHIASAYVFLIVVSMSCSKQKLEGENQKIEGKWRWTKTISYERHGLWLSTYYTYDTIYPDGASEYAIEFDRKGCYKWYENDELISKSRIKSASVMEYSLDIYHPAPVGLNYLHSEFRYFDVLLPKKETLHGELLEGILLIHGDGQYTPEPVNTVEYRHFYEKDN